MSGFQRGRGGGEGKVNVQVYILILRIERANWLVSASAQLYMISLE